MGLPKRYVSIFYDGIKLADPSSPDNAYYLNSLSSSALDSIEVSKGSNNILYGPSSIAGSINFYSKNGESKNNKLISSSIKDLKSGHVQYSYGDKINKHDYFFDINHQIANNLSAMNDNEEKDKFKNNSYLFNYGYSIDENLKVRNILKVNKNYLNYDEVNNSRSDKNFSKNKEYFYTSKISYASGKKLNSLSFGIFDIERKVVNYNNSSIENYHGKRKSINLNGEYNFNLDNRFFYGFENEFDQANFSTWATNGSKKTQNSIHSIYLNYATRPLEKLNLSSGIRSDYHSIAGQHQTGKISLSYKLNNNHQLKFSAGTAIRFASLNDYFYDTNVQNKKELTPEKSYSVNFGHQKYVKNLKFENYIFYTEYDDNISNWAGNTDSGRSSYVIQNSGGKIKSKGIESKLKFKIGNENSINLKYIFTDAYDGEDCDDPSGSCIDEMPVRVPRHNFNVSYNKKYKDYNFSIINNFQSERRDYGNVNNAFKDVILDKYSVFDLQSSINFGSYIFYANINNLLNKNYEEAYQYSTEGRAFKMGFKKQI